MNEVQKVLEELTGLLDVFLQGLVEYSLVSGYSLSLSTCPELLEPSSRTLPLLLSLLQPLQQGIKDLLLQFGKVKIITCWTPALKHEKQDTAESSSHQQEDTVIEEIECHTIDDSVVSGTAKNKDSPCELTCIQEQITEINNVAKNTEIKIKDETSKCANKLTKTQSLLKNKVIHKTPGIFKSNASNDTGETKRERLKKFQIVTLDAINKKTNTKVDENVSNSSEYASDTTPSKGNTTCVDANLHKDVTNWNSKPHLDDQEKLLILQQVEVQSMELHGDNSTTVPIDVETFHEDISQDDQQVSLFDITQESEEESRDLNKYEEEMFQKKELIKPKFKCSECHREFKTASSLETHRVKVHTAPQCCDMCGQMLGSTSALQEHCRTVHEGIGCFQCSTCKKRFMLRLSFRRHLETHEPATSAVCEICGKTFRRADYLQRHYLSHTGQRPHVCNVCGKRFICSSHLKNHSTLHNKQPAHSCKLCGRGFARTDKLKEHMLRHLNVKKHSCSACGKEYAERRDLRKHLTRCQKSIPPD